MYAGHRHAHVHVRMHAPEGLMAKSSAVIGGHDPWSVACEPEVCA